MEQIDGEIFINYSDPDINDLIKSLAQGERPYTRHFNQNEEFFIRSGEDFIVPSFPIHHDVRLKRPEDVYREILSSFLSAVIPVFPQVFEGMTYFFDPAETLKPCFFQILRTQEKQYLFLLRIDLLFKTHEGEMVQRGTNDKTASFRTQNLFLEGDLIPLESVRTQEGKLVAFKILQTVSQTWIGETGRGYFVQGIWMDNELTKFFSKLFLPENKRLYPYYPFVCKYRTITHNLLDLSLEGRKTHLPHLVKVLQFIEPEMETIQTELRSEKFDPNLEIFIKLKRKVSESWVNSWEKVEVKRYLNDHEMKEFEIELQS